MDDETGIPPFPLPQPEPLSDEALEGIKEWALNYVRFTYPEAGAEIHERYTDQILRGILFLRERWGAERGCPSRRGTSVTAVPV